MVERNYKEAGNTIMKWVNVILIGVAALIIGIEGAGAAGNKAVDDPDVYETTFDDMEKNSLATEQQLENADKPQIHQQSEKPAASKVQKTEHAMKTGAKKTVKFFRKPGEKIREWFKGR